MAMISALVFAIVAMVRIQLDWPVQEAHNFLLNCLHYSLALGAIFGFTIVVAAKSRLDTKNSFVIANLSGAAAVVLAFLVLYLFGGTDPSIETSRIVRLTTIAQARMIVAMHVSLLAFIMLAAHPEGLSDFARAFFMTHKAFFIALLYGLVMYTGSAGVAAAVQALLYRGMSSKVYMYIGTIVGFIAYAIFIGYFPDFSKGSVDTRRKEAQNQPRFIEVLFEYIMAPLALALTTVLLLWSLKTVVAGMDAPFTRLSGIATSYATFGLWLYIMVTHATSGPAKFYRRIYPFTALVILIFEARALLIQVGQWGIKTAEYSFIIIWIISVISVILLIIKKRKAYVKITTIICILAIFSVLPQVGYHVLPVTFQVNRLEKLLNAEGMLKDGKLIPAITEPDTAAREMITDSVGYLAHAEGGKLPPWFDNRLNESAMFRDRFGFDKTWPKSETQPLANEYTGIHLTLPDDAMDISEYRWAVNMEGKYWDDMLPISIEGNKGVYKIYWGVVSGGDVPVLRLELDGRTIIEQSMNEYLDSITDKYPPGRAESSQVDLGDMSHIIDVSEVKVLLVFDNVNINTNARTGDIDYWLNPRTLYMREND